MVFVKEMWPEFIEGRHHKKISEKFNQIATGKIKRLIINMPPRHTKSEFASIYFPSYMLGLNPKLISLFVTFKGGKSLTTFSAALTVSKLLSNSFCMNLA